MSIKPVTYQGVSNFRANLYALEVKSRFIDQSAANGYYKGYGDELKAIVSSNVVTVGSGALLIQGRLNEIESGGEPVAVTIQNGYAGYIIARIETYHPDDYNNCTLLAKTGASLDSISLTQEDTYHRSSDVQNKVYELPLYSFAMSGGAITNLTKLIAPIEENTHTRDIANAALAKINEAYDLLKQMLEQSYVENSGNAKTANTANALAAGYDNVTVSNGSFKFSGDPGKSLIIRARSKSTEKLEVMVVMAGSYSTRTVSGCYCFWSMLGTNPNVITFYDENGNVYTPDSVSIREI